MEALSERQRKFFEESNFKRTVSRITRRLSRHGYGHLGEDCAQEFALRILRGQSLHQSHDQIVIDYLRKRFGRPGTPGFGQRKNRERASSYEQGNFDRTVRTSDRMPLDDRLDLLRMDELLRGRDKEIFRKRFFEGLNEAEIGNQLGISESRVSQRLQRIQSGLRSRIAEAGSNGERESRRKMVEVLFGTWTRMEFDKGQSVALKEPGEMGALDEARFEEWIA